MSAEWYRIYDFDSEKGMPTWEQRLQRVHPDDKPLWQAVIDRAIAERTDYDVEFRIVTPHSLKYIHSIGRPVFDSSGELVEFVGVAMDVTKNKQVEHESERLRRLQADLAHINRVSTMGGMAASLAHEIKQPIGAAVTNADACLRLLDLEHLDLSAVREAASGMIQDAQRAADIIDRVRLLYQKGSPHLDMVDVNELIREMVIALRNDASRKSVTLRTELVEGLPTVAADRVRLQQALMNLIVNGIEAIGDVTGEVIIKSQVRGRSADDFRQRYRCGSSHRERGRNIQCVFHDQTSGYGARTADHALHCRVAWWQHLGHWKRRERGYVLLYITR
jgi:C4-dicarboxylate-specific signal transduction histidine kinase